MEHRNKDGEIESHEQGLSDVAVFIDENNNSIYDQGENSVVTDAEGFYEFTDLDIATYSVGLVDDFGWQYTYPSISASGAVATSRSETIENFEVGSTSYFQDVSNNNTSLRPDLNELYSDFDGTGQTVVVIDTGIDTNHPFFGDRIIHSETFGNGLANGEDDDGHGTHVSGIIASSDEQFTGVAPNADIIALKVLNSGGNSLLEKALQWCIANADEYSIDVVNLSLGKDDWFSK